MLRLGILETDKPMGAMTIHYLAVRGAPRSNLQLFTDRTPLGQAVKPGTQFGGGGRAEEREDETGTSERLLSIGGVGCIKGHRPAEDAVCDGLSRAVIAPELSERVENELPAEDPVVEGQHVAGCAREA